MLPRRAMLSLGAPRARWTIYWSVHQYQRPITGAQIAIPSKGKFWLKYHAWRTVSPAAFLSQTGAQVPSTPGGMSGFHRDSPYANSAVVVNVRVEDFGDGGPLAGLVFRRHWEEVAFRAGGGLLAGGHDRAGYEDDRRDGEQEQILRFHGERFLRR